MSASGSWFEDSDSILSDINITPLVDVALVLLIIFMITAPMLVQGANVRLPQTEQMERLPETGVTVSIDAEGKTFVNDTEVPFDELEDRLRPLAATTQDAYLRADRSLDFGTFVQVMEKVRRAGLLNMGIVTDIRPGADS